VPRDRDQLYPLGPTELAFTMGQRQSPVYKMAFKIKSGQQISSIKSIIGIETSVCVTATPQFFITEHHKQETTLQNFNNIQQQNKRINCNTYVGLMYMGNVPIAPPPYICISSVSEFFKSKCPLRSLLQKDL
jgi:hypothetical protein